MPIPRAFADIYRRRSSPGSRRNGDQVQAYVRTTMTARKSLLDHRLSDIAQNHQEKIVRRLEGFMTVRIAAAKLSAIALSAR